MNQKIEAYNELNTKFEQHILFINSFKMEEEKEQL